MVSEKIKELALDFFGDQPIFFLKFSSNLEHLKSLQKGNLFMNNLQYYVDLEEKSGIPGMGDKLEALSVINDVEVSIYQAGTNKLLGKMNAKQANMRHQEAMNKPVFCLYSLTIDMFEIIEYNEPFLKMKIKLSQEELDLMEKQFGNNVLLLSPPAFEQRINQSFKEQGYDFVGEAVKYHDFMINETKRIEAFGNQSPEIFFFKDKKFEHQKEFRIVILDQDIDKALNIKIPSLEHDSIILETSDLTEIEANITFNKNEI